MDFKTRYQYNPRTDLLGKGGFSRVYKATDTVLDRVVALKIFSTETSEKYDLVSEIKKVIKLEHPNLCRYYDVAFIESVSAFGEEEKHQIGVLEYLDGGDLKTYCRAHPDRQVKLLTDVLQGLAFLHKRGIIHRDLKPLNILIKNTEDGIVAKITDFGISKEVGGEHSSSSLLMGTIEYMAPEQFNLEKYGINGKINTNLDLWSFGVMVYELCTGHSLFGSRSGENNAERVMAKILNDNVITYETQQLPEFYQALMRACLVKDAGQRAQTAGELIAILEGKMENGISPTGNELINLPPALHDPNETIVIDKNQQPAETPIRPAEITAIIITTLFLLFLIIRGCQHSGY